MKEILYYIKDEIPYIQKQPDGSRKMSMGIFPIGAVVVIEEDGVAARGVSICAEGDNFSKKIGRDLAQSRAIKAWKHKKCYGEIRRPEVKSIVDPMMFWRLEYDAQLTEFEIHLLKEPKSV